MVDRRGIETHRSIDAIPGGQQEADHILEEREAHYTFL